MVWNAWNFFAEMVRSVPNIVWSGITGSVITLIGVFATNVGMASRHRSQLKASADESQKRRAHEAMEAERERQMALRRDVYLPAIEGGISALQSLSSLIDVGIPRADINKKYYESVEAIAKAIALSPSTAAQASIKYQAALGRAFMDLGIDRGTLDVLAEEVKAKGGNVTRAVNDQSRWVETQTQLLFEGPPRQEKWTFVADQLKFIAGQIEFWSRERDQASIKLAAAQVAVLDKFILTVRDLSPLSTEVVIQLRRELGLPDDAADLRKVMEDARDEAMLMAEAGLRRLNAMLDQKRQQAGVSVADPATDDGPPN
ncbi:hypothetical protein [Burkholderia sp. Bp8977]|uniref:hypothetical protein n=1 Tax=Burkholderia sp. Bp8977 TaxID=2184548 RepID=UPI000F5760D2|nr:hypothetical protein [Burkholderia sp. Bp8977]